jgi:hypothetical protein
VIPLATSPWVALVRLVFVCRGRHDFLWKRTHDGEYLECVRCLTVRVIAAVVRSAHA